MGERARVQKATAAESKNPYKKAQSYPKTHTRVPYDAGMLIRDRKVSGEIQFALIQYIAEHTVSSHAAPGSKNIEVAPILAKEIAEYFGITESSAGLILRDGAKRGLWHRQRHPKNDKIWLYRLTPDKWNEAPRWVPRPEALEDDEPDAKQSASVKAPTKAAAMANKGSSGPQIVPKPQQHVEAGQSSEIELDEPVTAVVVDNATSAELIVTRKVDGDTLHVSISAAIASVETVATATVDFAQVQSGQQIDAFKIAVSSFFRFAVGRALDHRFAAQLSAMIAGGDPQAYFEHCKREHRAMKTKGKMVGSGMFLHWAREYRETILSDEAARAADAFEESALQAAYDAAPLTDEEKRAVRLQEARADWESPCKPGNESIWQASIRASYPDCFGPDGKPLW